MKLLGKYFFKYRSYTPLPCLFVIFVFIQPNLYSILSGIPLILAGELIRIWAVSYAGSETRTTDGVGGTNLVTQGPFSMVRNPLYLGNVLIYTGIGIMSFTFFPYLQIFGLFYFTFQYYCIILNEEEYLKNTYKDKFEIYLKSVSRFIPLKNRIPAEIQSNLKFDIKSGLKSESRSLQSITISSLLIIGYFLYKAIFKTL
jgi:protein-S-isoprenylcysteine O-methyltransferase Ste14